MGFFLVLGFFFPSSLAKTLCSGALELWDQQPSAKSSLPEIAKGAPAAERRQEGSRRGSGHKAAAIAGLAVEEKLDTGMQGGSSGARMPHHDSACRSSEINGNEHK